MNTPHEQQFAWITVELGLLDARAVITAMTSARDKRAGGEDADVRSELVRGGRLSFTETGQVLSRMQAVPYRCPSCGRESVMEFQAGARPVCQHDGAGLHPTLTPRSASSPVPNGGASSEPLRSGDLDRVAEPAQRHEPAPHSHAPAGNGGARAPSNSQPRDRDAAGKRLVGRRFGNYRLVKLIERNSKSLVYKASIDGNDAFYAVKILLVNDQNMRKRLQREGQLLTRISHPNVIDIVEVGAVDKYLYLAMEFVEGHSLQGMIDERGTIQWREASRVFLQVLAGLTAAHAVGIIHRDIKPGNIMVGTEQAKILDFGMSRLQEVHGSMTNLTELGTTLGTPAYIAPEQLQTSKVGFSADLYSLGATIFHTVTGNLPFERGTTIDMLMARLSEDPPVPSSIRPDLPGAMDDYILRLLAREPDNRFESAEAAAQALQNIVG